MLDARDMPLKNCPMIPSSLFSRMRFGIKPVPDNCCTDMGILIFMEKATWAFSPVGEIKKFFNNFYRFFLASGPYAS
jgi:hypothetical protein